MQLLSLGVLLAQVAAVPGHHRLAEVFQREETRRIALLFIGLSLFGQLILVLGLWLGSKMVIHPDNSTFMNAVKVWLFYLGAWFLGGILIALGLPMVLAFHDTWRIGLVAFGALGIMFLMVFLIPMKVYVTGFLRALVIVLVAVILQSAVTFGLRIALLGGLGLEKDMKVVTALVGANPREQASFIRRLAGFDSPDEIERLLDNALQPIGPLPPLKQREATVIYLQKKLEARRLSTRANDPQAMATYQDELKRYLSLRDQVLAERSAPPAAAR